MLDRNVTRLAVGVIVNTMDRGDGFKMHAMKRSGTKIMVSKTGNPLRTVHSIIRFDFAFNRFKKERFIIWLAIVDI